MSITFYCPHCECPLPGPPYFKLAKEPTTTCEHCLRKVQRSRVWFASNWGNLFMVYGCVPCVLLLFCLALVLDIFGTGPEMAPFLFWLLLIACVLAGAGVCLSIGHCFGLCLPKPRGDARGQASSRRDRHGRNHWPRN